jgi:hypothetical protein
VDAAFEEVTFSEILHAAGVIDPVALAGVQDNASARMIAVPVGQADKRYILKVDPPEYPHVVENEAYFLARAALAHYPVVGARTVHDSTGRPGLLVERFDRVNGPDGQGVALAVEHGAQVMDLYPSDKYRVSAEAVVAALSGACAARVLAARDIFRQLCFAWLTGKGDVHAKNISILATPAGEWRVSPAYDLPSTLPYRDHSLALSMLGKHDGLSRRSLLAFADAVGVPARAAERTPCRSADSLRVDPRRARGGRSAVRRADHQAVGSQPAQPPKKRPVEATASPIPAVVLRASTPATARGTRVGHRWRAPWRSWAGTCCPLLFSGLGTDTEQRGRRAPGETLNAGG